MTAQDSGETLDNSAQQRSARSAKTRQQIGRAWLMRSRRDATEHAILGTTDLGYATKHPIKSASWLAGFMVSGLLTLSLVLGALHLLFGQPGSVAFEWDRPTTWFKAGADLVREPLVQMLGGTANRINSTGGSAASETDEPGEAYDPNSFDAE